MSMKSYKNILLFISLSILIFLLYKLVTFNSIRISKVEVDSQKSIWNNIIIKNQITGFSHDVGYTYDNWGWGLFLDNDGYDLASYEKHHKQLLLIKSFQDYLRTNLLNNTTVFDSEDKMFIDLLNLNEKEFLKVVLESYFGDQDILKYIKNYLPDNNKVKELQITNPDEYEILNNFYNAFYRDYFPIFNFLITNNTDEDIVIDSAFIEFKNIKIYSQDDSSSDTSSFDNPVSNNWYFDIFTNNKFDNWYKNILRQPSSGLLYSIQKIFNPDKAMHYEYRSSISSYTIDLKPQNIIPAKDSTYFQAKLIHNNGMPCKIRFNFIYDNNKTVKSDWYTFTQTSMQYH